MLDTPLFRTVDHALRFAYEIEYFPVTARSQLGRLLKGAVYSIHDLSPTEWHVQAAMIRAHVDHHLRPVDRACVECWYRHGPHRLNEVHRIVDFVIPRVIGTGITSRRLILLLVKRSFLFSTANRPTYRSIAEQLAINPKTVEKYGLRVWDSVNELHRRTDEQLAREFGESGLVG